MDFISWFKARVSEKKSFQVSVMPQFLTVVFATLLLGCAVHDPLRPKDRPHQEKTSNTAVTGTPSNELAKSNKKFEEPTELDKILDAKPITMAAIKPMGQGSSAGGSSAASNGTTNSNSGSRSEKSTSGKANYRLQIGAESTIDAAQAKKAAYEKQLGGTVDMVFDAPYYKLRWGYFETKQDAEDKLLELSDFKIQGFVVK